MKKNFVGFSISIAVLSILIIIFLATGMWDKFFLTETAEEVKTRIITVRQSDEFSADDHTGYISWEENLSTKIPLEEGEIVIAVLNKESEEGLAEEQFVVYKTTDTASPVYITYMSYNDRTRNYARMWSAPTAASRSETITLFNQDLIGDRNNCIVVAGMNYQNEHTMTIFRRVPGLASGNTHRKIAEIQIDGSIIIQEAGRPLAYQQGISTGQSFNIAAYGHDTSSANIMDQIETIYSFSSSTGQYEQIRVSRIPGSQIEQRRLREILSGTPQVFEKFINDLWYFITPQGTIDTSQYLYFDPDKKEIIFYNDGAQQVFNWQNSAQTRFGLYIRSQNISINTLFRFIDIELESLDSIRLRVNEDVRLRITANTAWDGSYRRAGAANLKESGSQLRPAVNALYDSSWGKLEYKSSGEYTINYSGNIRSGHYVFYNIDDNELIEMRPGSSSGENRMVYKIEKVAEVLILSPVRVGTNGIQDLHEPPVTLTPVIAN
ncbi:MAG: pallilysin-related adhesin [Treponema sp.]|nr:pallilysin-related adhesin [Treponema sp.]